MATQKENYLRYNLLLALMAAIMFVWLMIAGTEFGRRFANPIFFVVVIIAGIVFYQASQIKPYRTIEPKNRIWYMSIYFWRAVVMLALLIGIVIVILLRK